MKAVRAFVIGLTLLAVGFACEHSPTGLRQPSAPDAAVPDSAASRAVTRLTYDHRVGNYAVAW